MHSDPYNLDQTAFAQILTQIQEDPFADDLPDELPHPLRDNPSIAILCDHLQQAKEELLKSRKPNGEMGDDTYFRFYEGLELRPEVLMKIIIDYIKQHPKIISE